MDKRITLSIGVIVVIGILIAVINMLTPLPQETQSNNQVQEKPKNHPDESTVEQQEPYFEEELIDEEQDIRDEGIILLN